MSYPGRTVVKKWSRIYHGDEEIPKRLSKPIGEEQNKGGTAEKAPLLQEDEATVESISSSSSSEPSDDQGGSYSRQKYVGYNKHDEYFEKTSYIDGTKTTFDYSPSPTKVEEVILFGFDLSNLSSTSQFGICAFGVFFFNILYGYLQELIQIQIAGRQFAIFLGACQFAGYAFWSAILAALRSWRVKRKCQMYRKDSFNVETNDNQEESIIPIQLRRNEKNDVVDLTSKTKTASPASLSFLILAIIRAIDLGLTNLSMRYLNYPAKTLIKSSRVIFTMIMGIIIGRKKYTGADYAMVVLLVFGLGLFLHADMNSNAIFHPLGVLMLVTSLSLDGTVTNMSEMIMNRHNMGQDGFQMKLYFFSFLIMLFASHQANELVSGIKFFFQTPGTMNEVEANIGSTWSIQDKALALFFFCTFGIFGGSCACAITKRFGALTMSVTTTTRKAATIFVSFAMFPNACTAEHIIGVLIFVMGLLLKGGVCGGLDLAKVLSNVRTKAFSSFPLVKRASCFKSRV